MLKVRDVSISYGTTQILSHISLDVGDDAVVAIVGPNGHGKSTLLKSIAGLNPPTSEGIWFDGVRMDDLPPHEIVKIGVVLLPEGGGYLPNLTVLENLKVAAYTNLKRLGNNLEKVYGLFPWLRERTNQIAWTLSGGERRMLAIAKCLMTESKLLLLDEPTWGVAPIIQNELVRIVGQIRDMGISFLIAESNLPFVFQLADRFLLLKNNRLTPLAKTALVEKPASDLL